MNNNSNINNKIRIFKNFKYIKNILSVIFKYFNYLYPYFLLNIE